MGMRYYNGGPVDGRQCYPEVTPKGNCGHYHIYFGLINGEWIPYTGDTPYFQPRVIARYNCDASVDPSRYHFKRMEWIDR